MRVAELRSQAVHKGKRRDPNPAREREDSRTHRPTDGIVGEEGADDSLADGELLGDDEAASKAADVPPESVADERPGQAPEIEETAEAEEAGTAATRKIDDACALRPAPRKEEGSRAGERNVASESAANDGNAAAVGSDVGGDFEGWCAERPLGKQLKDRTRFDREARISFELRPTLERIRARGSRTRRWPASSIRRARSSEASGRRSRI